MPILQILPNPKKDGELITKNVIERFEGTRPEERAKVLREAAERSRRGLLPHEALVPVPNRKTSQHAPVQQDEPEKLVAKEDGPPDAPGTGVPEASHQPPVSAEIGEEVGGGLRRVAAEPERGKRQRRKDLPAEATALSTESDTNSDNPE